MIVGVGVDVLSLSRFAKVLGFSFQQNTNRTISWDSKFKRKIIRFSSRILSEPEKVKFLSQFDSFKSGSNSCLNFTQYSELFKFLSNRWVIKEAIYKAAFPHLKLSWKEVGVFYEQGKPYLKFIQEEFPSIVQKASGPLAKIDLKKLKAHVSLSHDGDYLTAFTVVEKCD